MIVNARSRWLSLSILGFATLLVVLPFVYQVGISFKAPNRVMIDAIAPFSFPLSIANYETILRDMPLLRYLWNSLLFAAGVTIGQIALAVPAAYAFSYYQFRFKNILLALVLVSLTIPFVVTYLPNYLLLARWKLLNTIPGMILPMLGASLGFSIFLLRQNFMSFPRAITEAAMIDGANSWQILSRVVTPANVAAIVAVAVYILINTWNQFIWPLLVGGGDKNSYTLTVGVQLFYANVESGEQWGALMAASVLASLPTFIIYMVMRRAILSTFAEGAIKG